MRPYVHYVPVKENLEDLLMQIQWMRENDKVVQNISRNAQEFVAKNLLTAPLEAFTAIILNEYAKLYVYNGCNSSALRSVAAGALGPRYRAEGSAVVGKMTAGDGKAGGSVSNGMALKATLPPVHKLLYELDSVNGKTSLRQRLNNLIGVDA